MTTFSRWRPHPWHGLPVGPEPPRIVHAYIEITPYDSVKYEVDKETGYIRVDRPQPYSSQPPSLYGFIPQTYCGDRVAALSPSSERGDGDPLDICVIAERPINRVEILVNSRVIGGFRMVDNGEADDKIVAVLENDLVWAHARDMDDLPTPSIDRLKHYFTTYKMAPGKASEAVITEVYGYQDAITLVRASMEDYADHFGVLDARI